MTIRPLLIIDWRVQDAQPLLASIDSRVDVLHLDPDRDGIEQIAAALRGRASVPALHVLSHGAEAALWLGRGVVGSSTLRDQAARLGEIGKALRNGGDIVLYGCSVAGGAAGRLFIATLAALTRANVCASRNVTGGLAVGGDWLLEETVGNVEANVIFDGRAMAAYPHTLGAGSLDTSFDGDGRVVTAASTGTDLFRSLLIQPDGTIVAVGGTTGSDVDFLVARYDASGSADASFGGDGVVSTAIGSGHNEAYGVARQSDGRLVVAGTVGTAFVLARYTTDGSLDTSFDTDGSLTTAFNLPYAQGYAVALQGDGRIVVAGEVYQGSGSNWDFALARYNADGSLDPGFDSDGRVVTALGGGQDSAYSVLVQDDKIVVAGAIFGANHDFGLVRYNANGSLDTTFGGGDGIVTTALGAGTEWAQAIALQSDGRIVAVGGSHNGADYDFAVVRYNSDGSLDTSFGNNGRLTTAPGTGHDFAYGVAVQADGRIVVAGGSSNGTNPDIVVVRYNSDGSLDATFGSSGVARIATGSGDDHGYDIALQADGNIVVAGESLGSSGRDATLVRLLGGEAAAPAPEATVLGNGVPIADADGTPNGIDGTHFGSVAQGATPVDHVFTVRNDGTTALTLGQITLPAGFSLVEGLSASLASGASDTFTVRLDSTTLGTKSGEISFATTDSNENPYNFSIEGTVASASSLASVGVAIALQPDGRILLGGYASNGSNHDFLLARYLANGNLDTGFGTAGRSTTPVGSSNDFGQTVTVQSNGKIVVAGLIGTGTSYAGLETSDIAVVRYNADGSLDATFSDDGRVTTGIVVHDAAYDVAVQSDGGIVVVGDTYQGSASDWDFALVRYNVDGSLDTGFGGEGTVVTALGGGQDSAYSVLLLGDGDILVGGAIYGANHDIGLVRYNADGSLDTGFGGGDGIVTTSIGNREWIYDMALQADGKIVAVGGSEASGVFDFAVVRYNADGSLDTSFGDGDGIVTNPVGSLHEFASAVALQADGRIVVAGSTNRTGEHDNDMAVVRYNADGTLDTSFSGDGILVIPVGSPAGIPTDIAAQPDGTLVLVGSTYDGTNFHAALVLIGTDGDDVLIGGLGDDRILAFGGNDTLDGGAGRDSMEGGSGADRYFVDNAGDVVFEANNNPSGSAGLRLGTELGSTIDTVVSSIDYVLGEFIENLVLAVSAGDINGTGNTLDNVLTSNEGNNVVDGQGGVDTVSYTNAIAAVAVSLAATGAQATNAGTDTLANIENLTGSAFADALTGNSENNTLAGGGGNDTLAGGEGSDTAVFSAAAAQYSVMTSSSGTTVVGQSGAGADGLDQLSEVEQLQFADGLMPLSQARSFWHYIASYPDLIAALGANEDAAVTHYISNGWAEGRSPSFDGLRYTASHADLIGAFGTDERTATTHYVANGFSEGRTVSFDGLRYTASYADLIQAFGTNAGAATLHYITNGFGEGRSASFDGLKYIASYTDLIQAFGSNPAAGTAHYIANGFAERRSASFDGLEYIASYADLRQAFGADAQAGTAHYVANGFAESRSASFDGLKYIASYGDLIAAFGVNASAGAGHFISNGFAEGRTASFNAAQYLANYPDLQAAFGGNHDAATEHYIGFGFGEGRTDDPPG